MLAYPKCHHTSFAPQVADALRERAQRVYEKYGTVMVNMEGMSQVGA